MHARPPRRRRPSLPASRRVGIGFTLVELLVVIAIIALLLVIVLLAVGGFRDQARLVECMSNQHQLQVGLVGYSQENGGKFISPRTSPLGTLPKDLLWVRSYNGDGNIRLDGEGYETIEALEDGALWPFVGDDGAYRSPLDPTPRIRSYAVNGFVSDLPDNPTNPEFAWGPVADRISKIRNPSNTLYTIPEQDKNVNFNSQGWVIDVYQRVWKDFPAFWEPRGKLAVSFIDGSSRIIEFADVNLVDKIPGHETPADPATTLDFDRFAEWVNPDE